MIGRDQVVIRCIDFETTGFPPNAGVCEVGWTDVTVTADEVQIGETYSLLCNPGRPIGPDAAAVHGITDEMVADEIPAVQAMARLMPGADVFCAHNCQFEQAFFGGGEKPWICSYKVALWMCPDFPTHKNGDLPSHLGIELDPARCAPLHRAAPDTYVTACNLFTLMLLARRHIPDRLAVVENFIGITKRPRSISRMPFGKHKGVLLTDLPVSYLRWAVENMQAKDVAAACKAELKRRTVPA